MSPQIGCPGCTNGTRTNAFVVGDGVPGETATIEVEEVECQLCEGSGTIDKRKLESKPPGKR